MYQFILIQYQLGHIDPDKVQSYVPKWINQKQADEILGNSHKG